VQRKHLYVAQKGRENEKKQQFIQQQATRKKKQASSNGTCHCRHGRQGTK
jgi:hypothetical protein